MIHRTKVTEVSTGKSLYLNLDFEDHYSIHNFGVNDYNFKGKYIFSIDKGINSSILDYHFTRNVILDKIIFRDGLYRPSYIANESKESDLYKPYKEYTDNICNSIHKEEFDSVYLYNLKVSDYPLEDTIKMLNKNFFYDLINDELKCSKEDIIGSHDITIYERPIDIKKNKIKYKNLKSIYSILDKELRYAEREYKYMIIVNRWGYCEKLIKVAKGYSDSVVYDKMFIINRCKEYDKNKIILIHNHPLIFKNKASSAKSSKLDIIAMNNIRFYKERKIKVVDNIIYANGQLYSSRENKLIKYQLNTDY